MVYLMLVFELTKKYCYPKGKMLSKQFYLYHKSNLNSLQQKPYVCFFGWNIASWPGPY